ncbi:uncharacterized protein LOC110459884 [Mizuhopecten yessoensis]|uniref:uncharacterized protein LOC110459884 n=1 Tax=Mizuhopecten yessoensis TaxID=6573 RepID=UPI000B459310|nr:uncharacterized protein LOC110459884 [Mizuhopecten yessoensis]
MQSTNVRASPPDVSSTQLPYAHSHQPLLAFAGNDVRSYMSITDRDDDSVFVEAAHSFIYSNQGIKTPASAPSVGEEEYSPPTPPRTPNHSVSAPYQQFQHNIPDSRVGVSMRLSPLTVRTDLASRDDQLATPTLSCVHSDPCSLTSPRHTLFRDDMDSMLKTKHAMERYLYETIERQQMIHSVKTAYADTKLKPFPLKDPPKSKFKRQISTESNDPGDIKMGIKSPVKRLQTYDEPDYTAKMGLQNRGRSTGTMSQHTDAPCSDADNKKDGPASQHPYAMNVKWIYSETDPSPKKEEDFTEISVVEEMSKRNNESKERSDLSFGQRGHDTVRPTVTNDNIGRVPNTAGFRSNELNSGIGRNNEMENVQSEINKYRTEVDNIRTSIEFSNEKDRLSVSASPRKTAEVSKGIRRGCDMNTSDTVRLADYNKQKIGEDLQMMMSNLRNRDGRTTSTATTEVSHVTPKGFVFPPKANIQDPVPMSPRIVCTSIRPPFSAAGDATSRTVSTQRNAPMTSQRPVSVTSTRTACLSRQMMPSPTSKEQTMYGRDNSHYQRDVPSGQRRRFFHSLSDTDHSPSKHDIEQFKCLDRTISDPSCFPPSKKNMLTEDIIRIETKYLGAGSQYDDEDMSRSYSDEGRQYTSPQYPQAERQPGGSAYYGSDSARRQLFSEASSVQTQYKHRVPRDTTDRIPDEMASYLIKSKFCTADDIISFNEKEKQCPRETQDYRLPREWIMARHVAGNYRLQEEYSVRPQEEYSVRPQEEYSVRPQEEYSVRLQEEYSVRPQEEYSVRPQEEYSSRLQLPPPQVAYQGPSPPQRKRNRGEVDIRMVCEDFRLSDNAKQHQENFRLADEPTRNCKCANVENEILDMAHDAFQKIRRKDDSNEAMEQFGKEVLETKSKINEALDILRGVKAICKHDRDIVDMFSGSVVFRVRCPTVFALNDLWDSYQSGDLATTLNRHFITDTLRSKYLDMDIGLVVTISEDQYRRAWRELGTIMSPGRLDSSLSKSDTEIASITGDSLKENVDCTKVVTSASRLRVIHSRCQSAPVTHSPSPTSSPSWLPKSPMSPLGGDRKFTFPGEPSSRRLFQERTKGSCSPTMKKLFDFELSLSPKTSPKRKTFAEGFPRENILPEVHSPKRKNVGTSFPFKDKSNDVDT